MSNPSADSLPGAAPARTVSRWVKFRIRLGIALMGNDFLGVCSLWQLIADRARAAVKPDGRVILSECQALADALYTQTPGDWTLVLTRNVEAPDAR